LRLFLAFVIFFFELNRDEWSRLYTHVLAIDALNFRYPRFQFYEEKIHRELLKCYAGFKNKIQTSNNQYEAIATGNWGCGAYKGDKQLKC
jgi:poly(ADP-ribose) glycohydrolase